MIITFYNVDFDENHVIYFGTKEKQDNYFTAAQIAEYTNARKFLDEYTNTVRVKFTPVLKYANYVKITIFENDANEVTTYYYITRSRVITDETIEFSIEKDVWQSEVTRKNIKHDLFIKNTNDPKFLSNRTSGVYLPIPAKPSNSPFSIAKLADATYYNIVLFVNAKYQITFIPSYVREGETQIFAAKYTLENALNLALTFSQATKIATTNLAEQNCEISKVMVIPAFFNIPLNFETDQYELFVNKGEPSQRSILGLSPATNEFSIEKSILSNSDEIIEFGNLSTRISLPFNTATRKAKIYYRMTKESFSIVCEGNGEIVDFTATFELPLIYSEASRYFTQNEMQRYVGVINSVVGITESAVRQNPFGAISSGMGIVNTLASEIDMQRKPNVIKGVFDNIISLYATSGFAFFISEASNANEIENYVAKYGYDIGATETDEFFSVSNVNAEYYYKCDYANFDNADREVRNYLENLFGAGVWIKWNT